MAPGLTVEERSFHRGEQGPFKLWVMRIDPRQASINVVPVHAKDRAMGLETTEAMARRYGALAAVNGGYFAFGTYGGISKNNYVLDGRVLGTWKDRSALIFCPEKRGVETLKVGMSRYEGAVSAGKEKWPLDGVNRERSDGELIWYTSELGPSTLTRGGFELRLDSRKRVVGTAEGDAEIPAGGSVLSGSGRSGEWLKRYSALGQEMGVDARVTQDQACAAQDIVSAGPRVVREGKLDLSEGGFAHAKARHPRTAAALTKDGRILFLVVDGRQRSSVGMTLEELGTTLVEMGAWEAVNLDGGGSSTFYAAGRIWNSPSDGRPRPVSDALLVFSIGSWEELRTAIEAMPMSTEAKRRLADLARARKGKQLLEAATVSGANGTVLRVLREAVEALR